MTDTTPPTPPADGTPPPAAAPPYVPAPAPKPVNPGTATTLIWRRRDRATLTGAATAVLIAWAIHLLFQVIYLIQNFSYAIDDGFGYLFDSVGNFFFYGIWQALFFFGPAFVVLWLLLPIVKESPLPVVLKRAAAAGIAGLAGLIFFGLVDGIFDAITEGFYVGYFGVDLLWGPVAAALGFTIYLVVGATITWLRAHRPAKVAPVAPAASAAPAPPAPPAAAPPAAAPPAAAPPAAAPPVDPAPPTAPTA